MSETDVPVPEKEQNAPEGVEVPEPDDLLDDSDLEMIEGSALMAEPDGEVDPAEEFDVEPTGDDPDEEDDDA